MNYKKAFMRLVSVGLKLAIIGSCLEAMADFDSAPLVPRILEEMRLGVNYPDSCIPRGTVKHQERRIDFFHSYVVNSNREISRRGARGWYYTHEFADAVRFEAIVFSRSAGNFTKVIFDDCEFKGQIEIFNTLWSEFRFSTGHRATEPYRYATACRDAVATAMPHCSDDESRRLRRLYVQKLRVSAE